MLARDLQWFSQRRPGDTPSVHKVTATSYSFTPGVDFVMANITSGAATILLPNARSVVVGKSYAVLDISGTAATNNITVKSPESGQLVNGAAYHSLQSNYAGAAYVSDGTNWFLSPM